jgi:hypothetical protein
MSSSQHCTSRVRTLFSFDIMLRESRVCRLFGFLFAFGLVSLVTAQSYAPINVTCPGALLIRSGESGLSTEESQYISQRRTKATQSLESWLGLTDLQDFDVSSFLANASNVPTLAIAFSGGGYRAMLNGAGVFQGPPRCAGVLTMQA